MEEFVHVYMRACGQYLFMIILIMIRHINAKLLLKALNDSYKISYF